MTNEEQVIVINEIDINIERDIKKDKWMQIRGKIYI